ncbi:MAG TPA: alpha/beta fold hydrolase [Actinospica sp.]|nr:alpha/beta fold hydrolase [Actinospica sp.]
MPNSSDRATASRVAYGDHPSQFVEIHRAPGPGARPVVALIHGGFWRLPWDRTLMDPLAADLLGRGYDVVNLEYRRLGEQGGGWPGTCRDVVAGLAAAAGELDLGRLALVGHSAGGHLALWAAHHAPSPVRLVVSQAGVCDLRSAAEEGLDGGAGRLPAAQEFIGGADYAPASPIELLPLGPAVHQLVVHGDADDRVPFRQGVDYVEAARAAGDCAELAAFPGMGHFELIDPAHGSWLRTVAALAEFLGA